MYNIQFLVLEELRGPDARYFEQFGMFDYRLEPYWINWVSDIPTLEEVNDELIDFINKNLMEPKIMRYRVKEFK